MKYTIISGDTDALNFCKLDQSPFTEDEQNNFINKLNDMFPGFTWELDGYYPKQINLAAKNYIMRDINGKITYKGSSLKSATLEPAIKDFLKEIIDSLLNDKKDFVEIYHKYIKNAMNITDIKPWSSKKTLSATTYSSTRANETKIIDAIEGTDFREGDKVYTYFTENNELRLVENFDGNYNKDKMLEKLYKATSRFWIVIDKDMFINYKLQRSKKLLEELLNG